MRFIGALDAMLGLAVARKLFDHFENTIWHKPTDCRPDGNDISELWDGIGPSPPGQMSGRIYRFLTPTRWTPSIHF